VQTYRHPLVVGLTHPVRSIDEKGQSRLGSNAGGVRRQKRHEMVTFTRVVTHYQGLMRSSQAGDRVIRYPHSDYTDHPDVSLMSAGQFLISLLSV